MGHGIVQLAAMNGFSVVGAEMSEAALSRGQGMIEGSVAKLLAKKQKKQELSDAQVANEMDNVMSNLAFTTSLEDLSDCDLVVEAITEDKSIKLPFYERLGELTKQEAILASNTSSLSIIEMAEASKRADRVVGLHFFNPVQLMPLVEVVRTSVTDPNVFELTKSWVGAVGKTAVSCSDTPGFIVNRLLVPYLAQAILMVERGDASIQDIDVSMKLGAGHPMGPLTLADYVGLDTSLSILQGWSENFPQESAFAVPELLKQKVAEGKLGRKSGEGFYVWEGDKPVSVSS
jgi:3-hydroxyacyl-CoA dehydrogenase